LLRCGQDSAPRYSGWQPLRGLEAKYRDAAEHLDAARDDLLAFVSVGLPRGRLPRTRRCRSPVVRRIATSTTSEGGPATRGDVDSCAHL
jgi:hypothetical protein